MSQLINLSTYQFIPLRDLPALRTRLRSLCQELQLTGTILIAREGINIGICGTVKSTEKFKYYLQNEFAREFGAQGFAQEFNDLNEVLTSEPPTSRELPSPMMFKETVVGQSSFTRMLVKIKKEIIPVGDSEVRPDLETGKRVSAQDLKQWLDEKRPIVLLDTRNDYEVKVGTFESAQDLALETSRDFVSKVKPRIDELKDKTVVTFCTGGIRCEKASAALIKMGLEDVYQLDGGILRYFEENGSSHFKGNCFVFDWRLAVDGELRSVPRSESSTEEFGKHRTGTQEVG